MFFCLMTAAFILISIFVISRKVNLHVDEVYTYGLANHQYVNTFNMDPEEGKIYEPAKSAWDEYMQVQKGHAFDYGNVWENQKADVHPPFYYVLIHTVCSFFPEQYSIWFAGSINIVFAVLTLWCVFGLARELSENKRFAFISAIFFALSAGTLSAVAFMRMYIVAMFWVCLVTFWMVRGYGKKRKNTFYVVLYLISLGGAMTHYYFLIYLFFICCVWGIFLLLEKNFREVLKFIFTMALSGVTAIAVFPPMIQQILEGHRGTEAVSNLKNTSVSDYWDRLTTFYSFINEQIFGGLFPVYLILFIFAAGLCLKKRRHFLDSRKFALLLFPCAAYFFLVAKIAAYSYDRYIQPIYPVVMTAGCYAAWSIFGVLTRKNKSLYLTITALAASTVLGVCMCQWPYLYRESSSLLERASEYGDYDCIYIYDGAWKAQPSFYEVRNYKSVVFIAQDHLDMLDQMDLENSDGIVLCLMDTCAKDPVFEKLESIYSSGITVDKMGQYFFTTSYEVKGKS